MAPMSVTKHDLCPWDHAWAVYGTSQKCTRELTPQNSEEWELLFTYASFLIPWWDKLRCTPLAAHSNLLINMPILALFPSLSPFSTPSFCFLGSTPFGNTLIFQGPAKYYCLYKTCPDLFRRIKFLPSAPFSLHMCRFNLSLCIISLYSSFAPWVVSVPCQGQVRRENGGLARPVGN